MSDYKFYDISDVESSLKKFSCYYDDGEYSYPVGVIYVGKWNWWIEDRNIDGIDLEAIVDFVRGLRNAS